MTTRVSVTSTAIAKISRWCRVVRRSEDGAAAVEFGMTVPILVVVLLGIIELSMLMFATLMLDVGIRDAARFGLTGQGSDNPVGRMREIERIVQDRSMNLVENLDFKIYTYPGGFGTIDLGALDTATSVGILEEDVGGTILETIENGDGANEVVLYQAVGNYKLFTPLFPGFFNLEDGIRLEASHAFRNEPWE